MTIITSMWRYILTKICKFLYFSLIFVNEYVWAAVHFIFNVPCMYVCEKRKEKTKNNFVFRKRNDRCDSMISNNLHACAREMVERLVCEIEKKTLYWMWVRYVSSLNGFFALWVWRVLSISDNGNTEQTSLFETEVINYFNVFEKCCLWPF